MGLDPPYISDVSACFAVKDPRKLNTGDITASAIEKEANNGENVVFGNEAIPGGFRVLLLAFSLNRWLPRF